MHSATRVPLALFGVFVLLHCVLSDDGAWAQEVGPPPPPKVFGNTDNATTIAMPLESTDQLQMKTKRPITSVFNQRDVIVEVQKLLTDPTTVRLTTKKVPGSSVVILTDDRGATETYSIVAQAPAAQNFDIALLRRLIKQAVPTSNVTPILGGSSSVILTGTVAYAEDIDVILRIAENIVRAAPLDQQTGDILRAGATGGLSPVFGPEALNTVSGIRAFTQLSIVNAMRIGGSQQVQLDVVVARVTRSEMRQFGFSNIYSGTTTIFGNTAGGTIPLGPNPVGTGSAVLNRLGTVSAPANNADLFVGLLNNRTGFLGFLQALRGESLAKLLAEPKLVTLSGRPAFFLSGGEQAVPEVSQLGATGVRFVPFGTTIRFLPIVLGNGKIYMEVEPTVSALSNNGAAVVAGFSVPGRVSQQVHTSVLMEDGQTFAIGGLIQHTVEASDTKVPLLGDMPFVGTLFSTKTYDDVEEELVVLVTPHLVDPMDCAQLPARLPGQETRKPDDFELFLEGILEAPRGPREIWHHHHYVAAFKNDPTLADYPCAGNCPPRFPPSGKGTLVGPSNVGQCGIPGGQCGMPGGLGGCPGGCGGGPEANSLPPHPLIPEPAVHVVNKPVPPPMTGSSHGQPLPSAPVAVEGPAVLPAANFGPAGESHSESLPPAGTGSAGMSGLK